MATGPSGAADVATGVAPPSSATPHQPANSSASDEPASLAAELHALLQSASAQHAPHGVATGATQAQCMKGPSAAGGALAAMLCRAGGVDDSGTGAPLGKFPLSNFDVSRVPSSPSKLAPDNKRYEVLVPNA